jgi:hypothetical protein
LHLYACIIFFVCCIFSVLAHHPTDKTMHVTLPFQPLEGQRTKQLIHATGGED